uniref:Uncharacterized protein n=1 Tax=Anguilla anguilla TaxID=7936 RepID=A0A0E9PHP4_ANGAN
MCETPPVHYIQCLHLELTVRYNPLPYLN